MSGRIGILAYGSLIEEPGEEIEPLIVSRIKNVTTPFSIEFARSSKTRGGAPTVIPVESGGSRVKAQIVELSDLVTIREAESLLWRRETGRVGQNIEYKRPEIVVLNTMLVEHIHNLHEIDTVLYTILGSNIEDVSPNKLADLAIASVKEAAGKNGREGISYLLSLDRCGIITKMSNEYERAILNKTGTYSLQEALEKLQNDAN